MVEGDKLTGFSLTSLLTREQTDHVRRVEIEEAHVYATQELQEDNSDWHINNRLIERLRKNPSSCEAVLISVWFDSC